MYYVISNPGITFLRQTSRDPEIWILCADWVSVLPVWRDCHEVTCLFYR